MPGKSNETEGSASKGVIISTPVAVEVIGLLLLGRRSDNNNNDRVGEQ